MKELNHDHELIEKYLEGGMSPSEVKDFLARVNSEPELADKLAFRRKLEMEWKAAAKYQSIKKQVARVINMEKAEAGKNRLIWMVAASVVVLATIGSLFFFINPSPGEKNDILASGDSLINQGETISKPFYKEMPVLASIDSVRTSQVTSQVHSVFSENDTIILQWIPAGIKNHLYIFSLPDSTLVLSWELQPGLDEYLITPGSFKPGDYMWYINTPSRICQFSITSQKNQK